MKGCPYLTRSLYFIAVTLCSYIDEFYPSVCVFICGTKPAFKWAHNTLLIPSHPPTCDTKLSERKADRANTEARETVRRTKGRGGEVRKKGKGTEWEGHREREGDERDVNDRDYWKINHACQGNRLLAIKPPSADWGEGRKEGKVRWGEEGESKLVQWPHILKNLFTAALLHWEV